MHVVPDSLWELFAVLDEGVVCLAPDGLVVGWNRAAAEFLHEQQGVSGEERRLEQLFKVRESEGLKELIATREGLFQRTFLGRNGEIPAYLTLRPLVGVGPVEVRVLILKRRQVPVRDQGASGIISFYSLLIHEVKNPLAAIKVLVQGVDLELSTVPQSDVVRGVLSGYLARVNREIDRVVKLLDSVKYLSRLTSDRRTRYDLVKVAQSVISHYTPVLERHRARCHLAVDGTPAELYGDPDELRQVLLNLMEHGLDAMGEGGELWITIRNDGEDVQLSVADNGAGMSEEELSRLYERSDPFRSGGLSLSVARWIVDRYKGRVTFESQKGRGTTVNVWLPAAPPPATLTDGDRGRR